MDIFPKSSWCEKFGMKTFLLYYDSKSTNVEICTENEVNFKQTFNSFKLKFTKIIWNVWIDLKQIYGSRVWPEGSFFNSYHTKV